MRAIVPRGDDDHVGGYDAGASAGPTLA